MIDTCTLVMKSQGMFVLPKNQGIACHPLKKRRTITIVLFHLVQIRKSTSFSHSCNLSNFRSYAAKVLMEKGVAIVLSHSFAAKDNHAQINNCFCSIAVVWIFLSFHDGPVQSSLTIILHYRRKQTEDESERGLVKEKVPCHFFSKSLRES